MSQSTCAVPPTRSTSRFPSKPNDSRLGAYVKSQPGWSLVSRFEDDSSAPKWTGLGLANALTAARAGRFDVLLVYRVDRFTRRIRDLVTLLEELDAAGVVFRSATEPFDTSTPAGRMLVQMLGVFAEFEREMIIDRVLSGMERKAAKGSWAVSQVPYGFARGTNDVLIPIEDEIRVVQLVFQLYTRRRWDVAPSPPTSTTAGSTDVARTESPSPSPASGHGATRPSRTCSPTAFTSARSISAKSSP